ncbi:MAG: ribosome maturation factor RimP [Elusimicrobiota bacterium]
MKEKILEIIKEDIEKEGFEIIEIKISRLHGKTNIRVFIDKLSKIIPPPASTTIDVTLPRNQVDGVTISDCEKVTDIINFLLDGNDLNFSNYVIEVSSPGIDRPLVSENDFAKNVGKIVMIVLSEPLCDIKSYIEGKIISVKSEIVTILDIKNNKKSIPLEKISKAKLKIEI